ncbi:heme biosynthesis HemY N-terminal domain-containing protein [Gilvimarinus polysaccharolyticus]|uniref:heme biosynthesis HemY N-terminal domain-containing protein n=1 Tax=Gilvimarinus polysaccharolyticus TaxID=863921 RepID=UPI00067329CD|nr:heme biosynthesis HemY N-terminal domain-containing protein [Gilvimarinus polysaccharolyticus]
MKKRLVILLLVMVAGAALFQLMRYDGGYVLIAYGNKTIEMSVWTGIVLWLIAFFTVWLVLRLINTGRRAGKFFTRESKFSPRSQSKTMAALVSFIEGDWSTARKNLLRSAGKSISPQVNYLAAARCAYELKDFSGALDLLHKAERSRGSSELAVALTQARMQLGSQSYEQCLATLNRIKRTAPEHPVVLDLLAEVYLALNDIDALEQLLGTLRKLKIRPEDAIRELEVVVYERQLAISTRAARKPKVAVNDARAELDAVWQRMGKRLQKEPNLIAVYALELHHLGCDKEAEPRLVAALKGEWRSDWVALYGELNGANIDAQIKMANAWLAQHDADAVLLCTLGKLSLRNSLWGQARDYFRASLVIAPTAEVYELQARLLQQLGEIEASNALYREGLEFSAQRATSLALSSKPRLECATTAPAKTGIASL